MKTLWLLLFITVCVFSGAASSSASSFPDKYDEQIKKAAELYLPGVDWRLWKAQLYQESRLDPMAVSPVGAKGLAQFMPGTWAQVSRQLGYKSVPPTMAEPAILAGAYYMATLRKQWSAKRPELDRHQLAAASYNAGLGNILKAQRRCNGLPLYEDIIKCLHLVTGHHSRETVTYVERIWIWWRQMVVE